MPFDYPGGYLLRFDGTDVAPVCEQVVAPRIGAPIQNLATLTSASPRTVALRWRSSASPAGDTLLHRWQQSSMAAGAAPRVEIAASNASGAPVVKWLLSNARPARS
jgi:hypothetical protein